MRKKYRGPTRRERNSTIFHHGTSFEQRKDESYPEWILWPMLESEPNRLATSKNRECFDPRSWNCDGIITRPDTNHKPSFIQGHSKSCVRASCTHSYFVIHIQSLENEASLREKMLSSAFHPAFFFPSLSAQERKLCHHKEGRKETNASRLSYRGKENLPRP